MKRSERIWAHLSLHIDICTHKVKRWYQKLRRGYTDNDVSNINSFVIDNLHEPLHEFVKYHAEHGRTLPPEFATDPAAWLDILGKIWYAVDDYWKVDHVNGYSQEILNLSPEKLMQHEKMVTEGFELFGKYFRNLYE